MRSFSDPHCPLTKWLAKSTHKIPAVILPSSFYLWIVITANPKVAPFVCLFAQLSHCNVHSIRVLMCAFFLRLSFLFLPCHVILPAVFLPTFSVVNLEGPNNEPFIKDIDPKTWVVTGVVQPTSFPLSNELPIAEKFRLAYAERDARLAPKRAKNARQQQRRAERDWMMSSDKAKAMFLASMATRSLHKS